jgi:oligopeptide transport system substrate-binding protein
MAFRARLVLRSLPSLIAASLVGLLGLLAGCGKRETVVEAARRSGVLHLAINAEPRDLDPQVIVSFSDMTVSLAFFEGLTAVDEATSAPVPGLAESWAVSGDGLEWTFRLRPGLRWSDGVPLTADDVVFSLRRSLSPRLGSEYAYVLFALRGAEDHQSGKAPAEAIGVRAPDARTVVVTLSRPAPALPSIFTLPVTFPVPRHVIERHGAADDRGNRWSRAENIVGSGPFAVREWRPNQRIAAVRNPHFRDAADVALTGIVFLPYESAAAQEAAFRAGQLHVTADVPLSKIAAYRQGPDAARLRADPFLETTFLRFNVRRAPVDDPRVRRALALAIDRRALVEDVAGGGQRPARSFTPPGTAGYTASQAVAGDTAEARRLLAAAGFPGGQGMPPLELMSFTNELQQRLLEAIQQMWRKELGVNATLALKEHRVWIDDERQYNYTISLARWIADYVDPGTFLEVFLSNGGNNATGWADPTYDRLVQTAAAEADPARRLRLYDEAEGRLLEDLPIAPLFHGTRTFLIHPDVRGWDPALLGFRRYQRVSLAAPER